MRYQKLGNTGLFVSELCLGTMTFGGEGGMWGKIGQLQQSEAEQLVARAGRGYQLYRYRGRLLRRALGGDPRPGAEKPENPARERGGRD